MPGGQKAPAGQAEQSPTLPLPSLLLKVPAGQGNCVLLQLPAEEKEHRTTPGLNAASNTKGTKVFLWLIIVDKVCS